MKMILKECLVSIKRNFRRYLSILLITLLGVGFFAGIRSTSPDMQKTLDDYYQKSNFMDLYMMSTWGIDDNDIKELNKSSYKAYSNYMFDSVVKKDTEQVVKIIGYNKKDNINKISLLKGRYPKNDSECLIEWANFKTTYKIGDKITTTDDVLKNKELTVVGVIKSPLYISLDRGSSKLLSGKVNFFLYVPISNFNINYYTEASIKVDSNLSTFSNKYKNLINNKKKALITLTKKLATDKYKAKVLELTNNLNNQKALYYANKQKIMDELNNSQNKINASLNDYNLKKNELDNNKNLLNNNYNQALIKLNDSYNSLKVKQDDLNTSKASFLNISNDYNTKLVNLNAQKEILEQQLLVNPQDETLKGQYTVINNNIELITNELNTKKDSLSQYENNLNVLKNTLDNKSSDLNNTYNNSINEVNNNYDLLNNMLIQINNSQHELNLKRDVAYDSFNQAESNFAKAQDDINNLKKPKYYVLDRQSNIGYYSYKADTERIANLGKIFPIVFFVVAILICLTSMTRMVEEERSQLGTLKALGYSNHQIISKYVIYAVSATVFGSVFGLIIGINLLPRIIFNMYKMMYSNLSLSVIFVWKYALMGTIIAILCTLFATLLVCFRELKESPATLMRPKSPKAGRRVLLEKIGFIWKRLNFTKKVTVRNVFRYKKRFLMTVIGIGGSLGLIITGFGLKDCITGMVPNQYEKVFKYQAEITFKDNLTVAEKNTEYQRISNLKDINDSILVLKKAVTLHNYKTNQTIQLVVPYGNIDKFITLEDRKTSRKYNLKDGAVVSEKLAKLLNINTKSLLVINNDDKKIKVKVDNITENYLYHFIYLNNKYVNDGSYNTIFIKTKSMNENEEKQLAKEIKKNDMVSSISFNSATRNIFHDTMNNFSFVALVLIISAGLLAFVVLYNLANVNISERKRELATIKVLGFYDKEVYDYIGRETVIMTILGIVLGIVIGTILTNVIIKTCELDQIMFNTAISIYSYIYSILIILGFVMIVNFIIYLSLKKINMIESLKSIE